jgi:hypothetical protein
MSLATESLVGWNKGVERRVYTRSPFRKGAVMIVFLVIGTIAGIMLGLRFNVFVLVPATLLATSAITVTGIVSGHEVRALALTAFGTAASLQIGYIASCFRHVVVPGRLPARTTELDPVV